VSFYLCGPSTTTANPNCSTGGTLVSTNPLLDVLVGGNPAPKDGISRATSDNVNTAGNPLDPGRYCFRAQANLTNYGNPPNYTDALDECFLVQATTVTTTEQRWLPNDKATVKSNNLPFSDGSVTFTLFPNGTCAEGTGTVITCATGNGSVTPCPLAPDGTALTNNINTYASPGTIISWQVSFSSNNSNVLSSKSGCERSDLVINDSYCTINSSGQLVCPP
jgi:hypothetical protein